ncbi:choice-of-anchor Q domain-containing protein [Rubrivirga sp. IMCC45206]|uniref:choice-of-anchor Q domain-containing protein n=1 Tax=Rubrivirga sp. IMCC45206 TaxID=3391614 RepID=UPI00398FC69F
MSTSTPYRRLATLSVVCVAVLLAAPAHAATITVDSDTDDGSGGCTLREAIESANTDAGVGGCVAGDDADDTVVFDAGVTFVQLTSQITITEALILTGNGAAATTVSAAAGARAFEVSSDEDVDLNDLTVTSAGSTAGTGYPADGGGVLLSGLARLTVTDTVFSNHRVSGSGGAIWVSDGGALSAVTSTFTGNRARGDASDQGGGAIYSNAGVLFVDASTFIDNRAIGTSGSGGAISSPNVADVDIEASTFTDNRAQRAGGGIELVGGTVTILDSQFIGNTAGANPGNGGAVHIAGDATVTVSGFGSPSSAVGNRAQEGGAFWVGGSASLTLESMDVTGNFADGPASDQGGGGIYVDGAELFATGVTIADNRAPGASGSGGGLFVNGGSASISDATISDNRAARAGGGIETLGQATVTLTDGTALTGNVAGTAPGNGGGLHMTGDGFVSLDGTTVSGNRAANEGGGLWASSTGAMDVLRTEVTDNRAPRGGGLFQQAVTETPPPEGSTVQKTRGRSADAQATSGVLIGAFVGESLVYANHALRGGGLFADGPATVSNSTVAGNEARFGGGVYSDEAVVSLLSATVARNTARTSGGGLFNTDPNNGGDRFVTLQNTIVAENTAGFQGPDLQGRYGSDDHNVISTAPSAAAFPAQANDQLSTDPLLEMLADNGGPTRTLALGAGSPAIDAGATALTIDQRGEPRDDGSDDVGAFEAGAAPIVLNEVLYDPPAGTAGDANGDGTRSSSEDEFVELVNVSGADLDLSGYTLGDDDTAGDFTFPAATILGPDQAAVLFGGGTPTGLFGGALVFVDDGTIGNGLSNTGDVVELRDAGGVLVASVAYGTAGPDGSATAQALAREPDLTGGFVPHSTIATNPVDFSPGTQNTSGDPFPGSSADAGPPSLATAADAPVSLTARPNPFSARTTASFSVAEAQPVTVTLYDAMGRRVQILFAAPAEAGRPVTVSVDGSALATGAYVLVLEGLHVRTTLPVTVVR